MILLILFVLAFAPGIFYLLYFYSKDRMEPEPLHLVIRMFVIGLLAAIPIALIESAFIWAGSFLLIILVAPVIEEYGKYLSVKLSMARHPEFDEPFDGIIYAVAAALGFASIENLGYLATAYQEGTQELIWTAAARAFLSVPGHALFSSMWGYALGMSILITDADQKREFILRGLLAGMLFHAAFNFLAFSAGAFGIFAALALILGVALAWRLVKQRIDMALEVSPHQGSDPDEPPYS